MLTGSDSKRLNIEEYHEDPQTQQRKLSGEIGQQKLFQHIFQLFFSVLSKSRHEPTYTKLEKRQGKKPAENINNIILFVYY